MTYFFAAVLYHLLKIFQVLSKYKSEYNGRKNEGKQVMLQ